MKLALDPGHVDWPATPDGDLARRYLTPLLLEGVTPYVANIHARLAVLTDGEAIIPLTWDARPGDSYVVSPLTHYVLYGAEELHKLEQPVLERTVKGALAVLGDLLSRAGMDRAVYVNNWLASTNLHAPLTPRQLRNAHATLLDRFPDRPIAWRSLDAARNLGTLFALAQLGYRPVFSRIIHYQDPRPTAYWQARQLQDDARRLRRAPETPLQHDVFGPAELRRARALYDALYLHKYSPHNPQFTDRYFTHAHRERFLTFTGLTLDGQLDAVAGGWQRGGVLTQPVFGYDTQAERSRGLYVRLTTLTLQGARDAGLLVNASGGVGAFKRARGGVPVREYSLVYTRHLPLAQRAAWAALRELMERWVVPVIEGRGL